MNNTKKSEYDFQTAIIELPSQGKCYPSDNPLSSGQIEIKYMTAHEEEILTSQNYIKKGVVLDKLFEAIIVDRRVNYEDVIIGDKNAILLATRILGYGPEYTFQLDKGDGTKEKISVDLSKLRTKDIDFDLLNSDNLYEFITPMTGTKLEFKILTHGDEKAIAEDVKALNKINKNAVSGELTTRYRYLIKSVDGDSDTKTIVNFINNRFLAKDSKAFREHVKNISPDVNMEYEYVDEDDNVETRRIPITVDFFWPSE
jgi:hypothetical protein